MIRNVLDPCHEAVRQPIGEAIVVGGRSPLLGRSYFLPLMSKKEGDCALPPEEGGSLQDPTAQHPGEPPTPLHKPLKPYPPLSDLRRSPPPLFAPPKASQGVA